ncbi:MAG: electron transfer flavoprotein subunit beta/FixA family protein [Candidatus Aminicenantes bacterium]|nr:MAG: electron transfer flavoprotein subunit beta/FixA family protein [Candidatus Aminicenantes bacterium]
MNIFVFVKRVPDTESKIRINQETGRIVEEGLNFVLNPYDEYAVEEALCLRESKGGKVTVISVGSEEALVVLKKCLAMGADEAVLLKDDTPEAYDGLRVAKIIAAALEKKFPEFDLLLCGKQSVGADNAQVPAMVAALMELPQANVVTKLEIEENKGVAHREIEGALEKVSFSLPAVISAQKGLNEPRYETLKGIMAAKRKEIPVIAIQDLEIEEGKLVSNMEIVKMEGPPPRQAGQIIQEEPDAAAKKLVQYLHEEAKII